MYTETPDLSNCGKVTEITQADFWEGHMEEESTRKAVELIPNGGGDHHGISLMEVAWKVVTVIIN